MARLCFGVAPDRRGGIERWSFVRPAPRRFFSDARPRDEDDADRGLSMEWIRFQRYRNSNGVRGDSSPSRAVRQFPQWVPKHIRQ